MSGFRCGDYVRDKITGIEGNIYSIKIYWFDGADVDIIREGVDCDGKPWPSLIIPIGRLEHAKP